MERWLPVKGYENAYHISDHGRVRSLHKVNPHNGRVWPEALLKIQLHTKGYAAVWLGKDNKSRKFFVHRLVAIAFIVNPEAKDYVNHINKERLHNHVDNLEWLTHEENMHHRDNYQPDNDEPF
tara:strand:+ start:26 stop:394 length:369 start_codon:yes stop_codon:yes gene_type:complete